MNFLQHHRNKFLVLLIWTLPQLTLIGQTTPSPVINFDNFSLNATVADLANAGIMVKSGTAVITNETAYSGTQSLKIEPSQEPGEVVINLPKAIGSNGILFVDFRLLPTAAAPGDAKSSIHIAGAKAGFLQVGDGGEILAFDAHSNGAWVDTGVSLKAASNGAIAQWLRMTLRLDMISNTWDLYVNGVMVAADLGMDLPAKNNFTLFGDVNVPIYLDDFYAQPINPLFIDIDLDGLPDAWETAHGGGSSSTTGTALSLRDSPSDANGLTLLQEYLQTVKRLSAASAQIFATHTIVMVHESIPSLPNLASILAGINAVAPQDNADDQTFFNDLATVLTAMPEIALAGLPVPSCPVATNITDALALAQDNTEIIVFPCADPFVLASFDPQGKQVTLRGLEGVVMSTPESIDEGRALQTQKLNDLSTALTAAGYSLNLLAPTDSTTTTPGQSN